MLTLLHQVVAALVEHQYAAMFGILLLCGLGLPLPEEITLVGSGLLVGWGDAEFLYATIACVLGILAGDSVIFGMGYLFGEQFLRSRPMRLILSPRRQRKVGRFFGKHGSKAVFFARFFAGVRIGVYAYAGSQRMSWYRFLFLDFVGAVFSGGISIWIGKWAALKFAASREEAQEKAFEIARRTGHWILLGIVFAIAVAVILRFYLSRRRNRVGDAPPDSEALESVEAAAGDQESSRRPPVARGESTHDQRGEHRDR